MDISKIETRGRPNKHNFDNFKVKETRTFNGTRQAILGCAKAYASRRGLDWKFITRTFNGKIHLMRVS